MALALGCTLVVVWLSDLHPWQEVAALAAGASIGVWAGRIDADAIQRRVDAKGTLDMYDEDVVAFVVAVAIIASAPFAFGSAFAVVAGSEALQGGLQGLVCSLAAFWVAHDIVLGRSLERLQGRNGRLRIRRFSARSVVGPQGLIGQIGVVVQPEGRTLVRVRGELWEIDPEEDASFKDGERVVVTNVSGLRLTVERQRQSSDHR